VHKTNAGDAFVGYGEIGSVYASDELSEEENVNAKNEDGKKP